MGILPDMHSSWIPERFACACNLHVLLYKVFAKFDLVLLFCSLLKFNFEFLFFKISSAL